MEQGTQQTLPSCSFSSLCYQGPESRSRRILGVLDTWEQGLVHDFQGFPGTLCQPGTRLSRRSPLDLFWPLSLATRRLWLDRGQLGMQPQCPHPSATHVGCRCLSTHRCAEKPLHSRMRQGFNKNDEFKFFLIKKKLETKEK